MIVEAIIALLSPFLTATIAKKVVAFILLSVNVTFDVTAQLSGVKKSTLYVYLNELNQVKCKDDVHALLHIKEGQGRVSKAGDLEDAIRLELDSKNYFSLRSICDMIASKFGLSFSETRVSQILKSFGIRKLKCGSIPFKANVQEQRSYYEETWLPTINRALKGEAVVYFMDGVHFVMGCDYLGGVYCSARRFVKTLSGRFRYNVLGAINYKTMEMVTVCNDKYLNAESVCEMLRKIAALNPGKEVCIFLDNAKYQKCNMVQDLAKTLNIQLLYIPPYSPNLNLIERVWKFAKSELRTRAYDNFKVFKTVIDDIMNSTDKDNKDRVRGIMGEKVQLYDDFQEVCLNTFARSVA